MDGVGYYSVIKGVGYYSLINIINSSLVFYSSMETVLLNMESSSNFKLGDINAMEAGLGEHIF
jgi:hypothetical protein